MPTFRFRSRSAGLAIIVAGLSVAMAACTSGTKGSANTGTTVAGTNTVTTATSQSATTAKTTAAPSTIASPSDVPLKFGRQFKYVDGLAVTVSAPVAFTPSESAANEPAKAYVMFTVTIVNGTTARFDPGMFTKTAQSADTEASTVYDSDIGGSPNTVLLPGRQVKFKIGYGVANPADIVMEVSPDFDHDHIIYTT